jgi:hypothetical protein
MKSVIPVSLVAALLAIGQPSAEAKTETLRLELRYLITVAGVETGRLTLKVKRTGSKYRISSTIRSLGLIDGLIGFRSEATTSGAISSGIVYPERHKADNIWRGDQRHVRISYGPTGPFDVVADPLPEDDDRQAVAPALRVGAIDALSAAYALTLAAGGDGEAAKCGGKIAVFDGRRRYDILTNPLGHGLTAGRVFQGRTFVCEIELHRIAGHSKSPWLPSSDDESGRIWFARLSKDWPPLPVRFEIDILLGSVAIHLQRAQAGDLDFKPAATVRQAPPPGQRPPTGK